MMKGAQVTMNVNDNSRSVFVSLLFWSRLTVLNNVTTCTSVVSCFELRLYETSVVNVLLR